MQTITELLESAYHNTMNATHRIAFLRLNLRRGVNSAVTQLELSRIKEDLKDSMQAIQDIKDNFSLPITA